MKKIIFYSFLVFLLPYSGWAQQLEVKTDSSNKTYSYTIHNPSKVVSKGRIYEWRIDGITWRSYTNMGWKLVDDSISCPYDVIRVYDFNKKIQNWIFVFETPGCVHVSEIYKKSDGVVAAKLTNGQEQFLRIPSTANK